MKKIRLLIVSLMTVISVSCTTTHFTYKITPIATQTEVSMTVSTPSLSPFPSAATVPTLAADKAYTRMQELLANNAGCYLPCLWGIFPGTSSTSDVQKLIFPFMGIAKMSLLPGSIYGGITFDLPMQDDSYIHILLFYYPSDNDQIINAMQLNTQAIHNGVSTDRDPRFYGSKAYEKTLNNFTLTNILSTYGIPSSAYVFVEKYSDPGSSSNFFLRILYPEKGIFISYQSLVENKGDNYIGCPSKSFISLFLLPPNSANIYQETLPTLDGQWNSVFPINHSKSLDDAVHMSMADFYKIYMNPTDRCLETSMSMWDHP